MTTQNYSENYSNVFVGRKNVFNRIEKLWLQQTDIPRSILFWGESGIGKSSLLQEIEAKLEATSVAYCNLLDVCPKKDKAEKDLCLMISDRVAKITGTINPHNSEYEINPCYALIKFISTVLDQLPEIKLILAIDWCERLDAIQKSKQISLVFYNGEYRVGNQICLELYNLTLKFKNFSVLMGNDCTFGTSWANGGFSYFPEKQIRLECLKEEEVSELISRQPHEFSMEASEAIWQLTGGHPALLKTLVTKIINKRNREMEKENKIIKFVTLRDIEDSVKRGSDFYFNCSSIFQALWYKPSLRPSFKEKETGRQRILKTIALAPEGLTVAEITKELIIVEKQVEAICDRAIGLYSTMAKKGDRYKIAIEVFRRWILYCNPEIHY